MFSLPLLYTMEVWWTGFVAGPIRLLIYLATTFILLLGYNSYAGMHEDSSWAEVMIDSVEEMGIGLLVSGILLSLLGRITPEMQLGEVIGKIVLEAMTVAIGISVGTSQLGIKSEGKSSGPGKGGGRSLEHDLRFGGQLVIAACGAMLFGANVAPTEEVVVIATEISVAQLLALMLLSLLFTALILYYIEFAGSERFVRRNGITSVVIGTLASYAVALLTAAAVLWFFGRFDQVGIFVAVAQTVVLGVATTLGASAGRLLVQ